MNISAEGGSAGRHSLDGALELYRDLSLALRAAIARLRAGGSGEDAVAEAQQKLIHSHQKSLQSVLDAEARLAKRSRSWGDPAEAALDLDAARAEILERLAVWAAER